MIEKVIPATSNVLRDAVEHFICTKRAINDDGPKPAGYRDWVSSLNPRAFIDRYDSGFACSPATTLRNVLPFFENRYPDEIKHRPARVPVAQVMGSSWRWAEHLIPNPSRSADEWESYLTSDERFTNDVASVTLLPQLGLFFVSGEGKNRVGFLARRNVEFLPCQLTEINYPEASRLKVFEVFEGPFRTWLCVLDEEFVCTIPYPELTLPILDAYGVPRAKDWPFAAVMPATVLSCLRKQRSDPYLRGMRSDVANTPLELTHLAELERHASEATDTVWSPAVLHRDVEFDWRRLGFGAGGLIATAAIASLFSATQPLTPVIAGAILTWSIGPFFLQIRLRHQPMPSPVVAALAGEMLSESFRELPSRKPSKATIAVTAGGQTQA